MSDMAKTVNLVGAACLATEVVCTYRCPQPDEKSTVGPQVENLVDLLMVPPWPVTDKIQSVGQFGSPRQRFKTYIFAPPGDASGFENLPDIVEGDLLLWKALYTGEARRKWYLVCGVQEWLRQRGGAFSGCSYLEITLEDLCIADDCWLPEGEEAE